MIPKLTFVRRTNRSGVSCVAPFINGHNVWDIPEKEFTPAVADALKSAYRLGQEHLRDSLRNIQIADFGGKIFDTHFQEVK